MARPSAKTAPAIDAVTAAQTQATGLETGTMGALRAEEAELAHLLAICFPKKAQAHTLALASLHLEVAKAHRVTSDPAIGTIRLKWWLDAIDQIYTAHDNSQLRKHPVVTALAQSVAQCGLSRGLMDALVESHVLDLEGLRPLGWSEASSLFASQRGNLFRLFLQVPGKGQQNQHEQQDQLHNAANHLGVAYGVWRSAPGLGSINDIPWLSKATEPPTWLIQALTHLDEADKILAQSHSDSRDPKQTRWMKVLSSYLRSGITLVARDQTPRAVAHQQTAAFGFWRRMLF